MKAHKEKRYTSTLSLSSALDAGGDERQASVTLAPGKIPVTHCIGGRVGRRSGLDGYGKYRLPGLDPRSESLYRLSDSGPPARYKVYHYIRIFIYIYTHT